MAHFFATLGFTHRPLQTLLVDCGYVTGCDLAISDSLKVSLYGPWKENDYSPAKATVLLSKDRFEWLPHLETYRCPEGHLLKWTGTETRIRSGGRPEVMSRYVCPKEHCEGCPLREQCTTSQKAGRSIRRSEYEELIVAHREKMETEEAKALYKLRGQSVEIVYADFKQHRALRRFSRRGLPRARTPFAFCVLAHNMLVLRRSSNAGANAPIPSAEPAKIAA